MHKLTTPLLLVAAFAAHAGADTALHYKASSYDPATGTWRAYKSEITLQSVHTNGGWTAAQRPEKSKAVYFDRTSEGVASPLEFGAEATNTIRMTMIIAAAVQWYGRRRAA